MLNEIYILIAFWKIKKNETLFLKKIQKTEGKRYNFLIRNRKNTDVC